MQIIIRDDLVEVLTELGFQQNRWPKQQAEWILQQYLEEAAPVVRAAAQAQGEACELARTE
jgi:hypothetical protein